MAVIALFFSPVLCRILIKVLYAPESFLTHIQAASMRLDRSSGRPVLVMGPSRREKRLAALDNHWREANIFCQFCFVFKSSGAEDFSGELSGDDRANSGVS